MITGETARSHVQSAVCPNTCVSRQGKCINMCLIECSNVVFRSKCSHVRPLDHMFQYSYCIYISVRAVRIRINWTSDTMALHQTFRVYRTVHIRLELWDVHFLQTTCMSLCHCVSVPMCKCISVSVPQKDSYDSLPEICSFPITLDANEKKLGT